MDTCIVESGFLKKKLCGKPAVTRCLNCEGALCAEHALPEMSASGGRTGKFLCQECKTALKDHEARLAKVEKPAVAKPAAKPAAKPPAPAAEKKPETPPAPERKESGGGLDFAPAPPAEKKPEAPAPEERKKDPSSGGLDFK